MRKALVSLILCSCCFVSGFAKETIKAEDLPEKVKTTLAKNLKGGEITTIEKTKNAAGDLVFECHIKMKNKPEKVLIINAKGELENGDNGKDDKQSDKEKEKEKAREKAREREIEEKLRKLRERARKNGGVQVLNPN